MLALTSIRLETSSSTLRARNYVNNRLNQAQFHQILMRNCQRPPCRVRQCRRATPEDSETRNLIMCAKRYTEDLTELGMSLQTIRRNVAGAQNNLGALTVYLNALDGTAPDNIDDIAQLKKILENMNDLRLEKAEEELFWAQREGRVVSPIVDNVAGLNDEEKVEVGNVLTNITMYGVQGAAWNAIILLVIFIILVTFVLR
jgi:hypothetical protein